MTSLRPLPADPARAALVRNSGWLLGDRLLRIGLGLLVNVTLARAFGPAQFGQFAYATTMAALFLPLATLGLERIVVRELAKDPAAEPLVLGSLGLARLGGGFAGWILATLWVSLADRASAETAVLVAWIAAGNVWAAFDLIDWSFQARGRFRPATLARLGAFVVAAAAKIALVSRGADLRAISAVVLAEAVLSAALQLAVWRGYGGRFAALRFDGARARGLLGAALPLLAAEVAVWLFQKLDLIILAHAAPAEDVGLYSVAQRLGQAVFFLPGLAVQLLSPRVAQADTPGEALRVTERAMTLLVAAATVIAIGFALGAGPLVRWLFGEAYAPAAKLLALLSWSTVFVFMGSAQSLWLVNRGHQVLLLRLAWVTAGVSVALNLALIPPFHAWGAAIANVAAYALTTVFGVALFTGSRPLLRVNLCALAFPFTWLRPHAAGHVPEDAP